MNKTAESIEEQAERKIAKEPNKKYYARGKHPNSHADIGARFSAIQGRPSPWKKGVSANPGGRPKNDVAKEIARAVFENNKEKLYRAFAKAALRGNAYAFKELADRAYGKVVQATVYSELQTVPDKQLDEQIADIERRLGLAAQIDDASAADHTEARETTPDSSPQD